MQIEKQQGTSDPEATAALAELKAQTATLARLQSNPDAQNLSANTSENAVASVALDQALDK